MEPINCAKYNGYTLLLCFSNHFCDPFIAVTIGFDPDQYFTNEADGSVSLMVRLISGVLEREIVVDFETSPGSATSAGNLIK